MRQRALHLVATCAAPNASCGVKPQAARGSGAEPVAAAAVIYVRTNPGRDIMLKGAGPSGNIQAFALERRARRVCSSDKTGTIAF
jgi:hypothetical protein